MALLGEKQIWDEVFDGNVQNAIGWTNSHRNANENVENLSSASSQPPVLYLEPSLVSSNGHQLNLADCYLQMLKDFGYRTKVVHGFRNSLPPQKDWLSFFFVKHHTMASRNINSLSELALVEHYFRDEFQSIIGIYRPRICIFATIRFTNVSAAAKALIGNNVKYGVFGVMEAGEVPDCKEPDVIRSNFSRAASLLQKNGIEHLFIAETDQVKTFLISCGFRQNSVRVYPYVAARQITNIPTVSEHGSEKIKVGYLGGSRSVRHPELIADLIVTESLPKSIKLHVQLDLNYIENECGKIVREKICALESKGSIDLYPVGLSKQEYKALFCSLDFIILPYGERYRQIGSGIFLEAIYAGVVPILPADSQMSKLYTSLGGEAPVFGSLTATSIREATIDALTRVTSLKKSAVCVQHEWRQHPSSTEQWRSDLEKWLPAPDS